MKSWSEELEKFESRLKQSRTLVLDLETDGLDWKTNKIVSYGFCFGNRPEDVFYFPTDHGSGNIHCPKSFEKYLAIELKSKPREIIGHNLIFDLLFLANKGIVPNGEFVCTMVRQSLINEHQKSFSLAECSRIMGGEVKKDELLYRHLAERLEIKWEQDDQGRVTRSLKNKLMSLFHTLPGDDPVIMEYVKGDVIATWQLWEAQQIEIEKEDLMRIANVEVRCTRALYNMQRFGIKVDEKKLNKAIEDTEAKALEVRKALPIENFNCRSPLQMAKLYEDYDKDLIPRTPKGGLSFNDDFLQTHELGKKILAVRRTDKLLSSFLMPLREEHLFKGYVHASYNQGKADDFGTVSGRLSCSNPNLQQFPKRDGDSSYLVRSVFIPEDGMIWSSNDLSQAEYRLFAHYTNDPVLIAGYSADDPIDMHTSVAKQLRVGRFIAKTLNFAILYGSGVDKMTFIINKGLREENLPEMTTFEVANLRKEYYQRIPAVKNFMDQTKSVAEGRGYVRTILGRRCRFSGYDDKYYKAANRVIQGSNADYTKLKLAEINEFFESEGLDKARLLVTIHDSVDWQFEGGSGGDKINQEAIKIFQNDYPGIIQMRLPMKVDSSTGFNWADAA